GAGGRPGPPGRPLRPPGGCAAGYARPRAGGLRRGVEEEAALPAAQTCLTKPSRGITGHSAPVQSDSAKVAPMKFRTAIAALVLAAALPAAAPAFAWGQDGRPSLGAGHDDQDQARAAVRAGKQIPLARVIQEISARN